MKRHEDPILQAQVRELHSQGKTDTVIYRTLHCGQNTVKLAREAQGLEPNEGKYGRKHGEKYVNHPSHYRAKGTPKPKLYPCRICGHPSKNRFYCNYHWELIQSNGCVSDGLKAQMK